MDKPDVMYFISRHEPTQSQRDKCASMDYVLDWVGDVDAFDEVAVVELVEELKEQSADSLLPAIACVHPLVAVEAWRSGFAFASFQNENRAPEGERPTFECVGLAIRYQDDS